MKTFKQFQTKLMEKTFKVPSNEKVQKTLKVGKKKKYEAVITKSGSSFNAYIDGDKLDTFKSVQSAEKAIKQFTDLMGK